MIGRVQTALRQVARPAAADSHSGPIEALVIEALGIALAFYVFSTAFGWVTGDLKTLIGDITPLPFTLAAAAMASRVGNVPALQRRARWAWRVLAMAFLAYAVGDAIWAFDELVLGEVAFPSWADAAYVLFYPLVLTGLVLFPPAPRTRAEQTKFWLDLAAVVLGSGMIVWYFVIRPIASAQQSDPLAAAIAILYPVGDLVLIGGVGALLLRLTPTANRTPLLILGGSLTLFVAADLAYGPKILSDTYVSGDWLDLIWVGAEWLLAVAAYVQLSAVDRPLASRERVVRQTISWIPYVGLALGYGLLMAVSRVPTDEALPDLVLGAIALTTIVLIRQVAALRENALLLEERAAHRREARWESLVQQASDVILIVDDRAVIRYATPSVASQLGHRPRDIEGTSLLALIHPDDAAIASEFLAQSTAHVGAGPSSEWRLRSETGAWRTVEVLANNLTGDANVDGIVLTFRDISDRKEFEEQLRRQAFEDPLTGLANRALFRDRVAHSLARGRRSMTPAVVLFLDLDNFKVVNDSLGHRAGDDLLREVADRVASSVRPGDTVARFAGDEFAILLADPASTEDATTVGERIVKELRQPFAVQGREVFVECSIGIASAACSQSKHVDQCADDLIRNADAAMYVAKRRGGGRAEVFAPHMHADALAHLRLITDLRHAIERDEFFLLYQPIVDLDSGALTGVEALVRWRHPERGIVPPAAFISIAEETGLVVPIGLWVLEQACRQGELWRSQDSVHPVMVSVNLSARQLREDNLVRDVAAVLHETAFPPHLLTLEVTESTLVEGSERVIGRLTDLKRLGIRLSLDDFGTGYSSLSYLQNLPIDALKIDKSFVDRLGAAEEATTLVETVVAMSRALHLSTVAEGIEDAQQADRLRSLGCALGQGYFFARPLPAAEITPLVGQRFSVRQASLVG